MLVVMEKMMVVHQFLSGGVDPYMINWQGVDSTSLAAGIYEVIITDANNCIETLDVEVNQPTSVVASFNVNQIPFTASASEVHRLIHLNGYILEIISQAVRYLILKKMGSIH